MFFLCGEGFVPKFGTYIPKFETYVLNHETYIPKLGINFLSLTKNFFSEVKKQFYLYLTRHSVQSNHFSHICSYLRYVLTLLNTYFNSPLTRLCVSHEMYIIVSVQTVWIVWPISFCLVAFFVMTIFSVCSKIA